VVLLTFSEVVRTRPVGLDRVCGRGMICGMADLTDDIETAGENPKKVLSDGMLTEEHGLKDLIAADKHLRHQAAETGVAAGKLPIQLFKFKPPGSV
jgi:hypothetical protein